MKNKSNSFTSLVDLGFSQRLKLQAIIFIVLASALLASALRAQESNKWAFDVSVYGLAAGITGTVGVGPVNADLDVGFDKIWDHLEFGFVGKVRAGYDRWALTTDFFYAGLEGSRNGISADLHQWMIEPTLSYRICKQLEVLAGVRYNNLGGDIGGTSILPRRTIRIGTQDWWDPVVGANLSLPIGRQFSFNVCGDIGGFGVGSDFAWQAFPYFGWQFAKWASLQAGYRWLNMDYESGSRANRFSYDMLIQGPQIGLSFRF